MNSFKKAGNAITGLLRQGVTPERIAISLVIGALIGVIPILGISTASCALLAVVFRLNLAAIQAVNWLVYPVQLALLIPFYRAGEWLFRAPRLNLLPSEITALFKENTWHAIGVLWDTTLHAIAVWGLASLLAAPLLYFALLPILRRMLPQGRP